MSQRSIRRAQERRLAAVRRRETLRRRRAVLATGAAIGATALFAPSADAATFEVNSLGDGAPDACDNDCTLRDAVTLANANTEADTITFKSGLTGTIRLTSGELPLGSVYDLTINGPGRDVLSISGDADDSGTGNAGDSRVFNVSGSGAVTISGLTMTEGYTSGSAGGAITAAGGTMTIQDSAITDSHAAGSSGGGMASGEPVKVVRTLVTGNAADTGAGIQASYTGYAPLTLSESKVSGNHANGAGGGIAAAGPVALDGTEVSGNTAAAGVGGALTLIGPYSPLDINGALISGNSAASGGAIAVSAPKYGSAVERTITDTTIAGNHATTGNGGAILVDSLARGDKFTVTHSTISGNDAPSGFGGGIMFDGQSTPIQGAFDLLDSTISGNTAGVGAGVSVGGGGPNQFLCDCGSIGFDNSTIASNIATTTAGGIYLASYEDPNNAGVQISPTIPLTSTIVADNTAAGAAGDLDRADASTSGGFDLSFSLVENAGDAPVTQTPAGSSIVGSDPQLGPLADNGGPTRTHLPAQSSPVIDRGNAPARLATDQRGKPRTVDGDPANTAGGDGTDIGAVEIENPPPNPLPTPPSPPPEPPVTPPKNVAPQAFIKKNALASRKAKSRRASGIASDDGKVAKVQVALVYKSGGNCRDLLASGHFAKVHRCGRPRSFITAKGTKKWTFALSGKLKPGYYVLYARAIDDKGLKQTSFGTKSRRPFRVRGKHQR